MSRFFESIKIEKGKAWNLAYHEQRVSRTLQAFHSGKQGWDFHETMARAAIPGKELFKCRVVYDPHACSIDFEQYTIKVINSLKLVVANEIDYIYKSTDRGALDNLFSQRGSKDDVLIVKNGLITDTSFANIVLMDNKGVWWTPSDCLLMGTMRQSLLDSGRIFETSVKVDDLRRFKAFKVINAMRGMEVSESEVSNID